MRSLKQAFPDSKLPVRGRFRVTCMILTAAAMTNLKCISRYLEGKEVAQQANSSFQKPPSHSFLAMLAAGFGRLASHGKSVNLVSVFKVLFFQSSHIVHLRDLRLHKIVPKHALLALLLSK